MALSRIDNRLINRIRWNWVDIALSTDRCDREQSEAAIKTLYHIAQMSAPDIVWCESPQELAATLDALTTFDTADDEGLVKSRLAVAQLGVLRHRTHRVAARRHVPTPIWYDPTQILGNTPVPEAVRWEVFDALSSTDALTRLAHQGLRIRQRCVEAVGMAHAPMQSAMESVEEAVLWDCFLQVGGIDDRLIASALDVLRLVGCVSSWEGLAIVSDRPVTIRRQPDSLTVQANGEPAIEWRDGNFLNRWNGIDLPQDFWDWTAEQAIACSNLELRSIAIEHMGWAPIADSLEPLAVADDPGNPGQVIELYAFIVSSGLEAALVDRRHFVRVTNASPNMDGTHRTFVIQVPPWIADPVEAVAHSFGISAEAYRNLARAC